jgi:uracil-DNA glycosylase family 4
MTETPILAPLPPLQGLDTAWLDWLILSGVNQEILNISSSLLIENDLQIRPINESKNSLHNKVIKPLPQISLQSFPRFENLDAFNNYIKDWKDFSLTATATHTLTGTGNNNSPSLMVITDCPDDTEDRSGEPFSGYGHQLVRNALRHAGIKDSAVYMTYLSKWRPPGQRSLNKHECLQLANMIKEEIRLIAPQAILVLGESVGLTVLGIDSMPPQTSISGSDKKLLLYINQVDNKNIPFGALQNSKILVKTQVMKKTFWFSLLSFLTTLRAQGWHENHSALNNLESPATFTDVSAI